MNKKRAIICVYIVRNCFSTKYFLQIICRLSARRKEVVI